MRRALRRSVWSRDGRDDDDGPIERIRRAGRELAEWRDFPAAWSRAPFDRDAELNRVLARVHEAGGADRSGHVDARRALPGHRADSRVEPRCRLVGALRRCRSRRMGSASRRPRAEQERAARAAGPRPRVRPGGRARHGLGRVRDADARARRVSGRRGRRPRRALARGAARRHRRLQDAEGARRRARFRRSAAARARSDRAATPRSAARFRRASRICSSTSSRTPIRCRPRSCCCSPPTTRDEQNWRNVTPQPGKLFIVGDPKQAIYRFRRADVETYREVYELLEDRRRASGFPPHQFPRDPGDPACGECGVRAVDDRRSRHAAGRIRPAHASPLATTIARTSRR